jgi:hypothetical protein
MKEAAGNCPARNGSPPTLFADEARLRLLLTDDNPFDFPSSEIELNSLQS